MEKIDVAALIWNFITPAKRVMFWLEWFCLFVSQLDSFKIKYILLKSSVGVRSGALRMIIF